MRETVKYSGSTHVGNVRTNNEDSFFLADYAGDGFFYCALADGMGGHSHGELASKLAIDYTRERLQTALANDGQLPEDMESLLTEIVQKANVKVYLGSLEQEDTLGMGTTLTILVLTDTDIWLAHVGDCRAYLYRDHELRQQTVDQTLVQEMLDAGSLTQEEVVGHPKRNVLTQALGIPEFLQPEIVRISRQKHDRLLLCSDGLYGQVSNEEIKSVMKKYKEPADAVSQLIQLALDQGGEDNITVLVISA
jgi:protein phosphatase